MPIPVAAVPLEPNVQPFQLCHRPPGGRALRRVGAALGLLAGLLAVLVPGSVLAAASGTSLAQVPLALINVAQPALVFAIDDSGSMDWEVLLSTNQGEAYWTTYTASTLLGSVTVGGGLIDPASGAPNTAGTAYNYLFPFGRAGTNAMPPTADYAVMRNAAYNPLYYNPRITYLPWSPSWNGSTLVTYPQASFSAARLHPLYGTTVVDLGATQSGTFRFAAGARVSASQLAGCTGLAAVPTLPLGMALVTQAGTCSLPYVPATYYVNDAACVAGASCVRAADGTAMRQVVVTAASAEAQNFANWFTYYRQRVLLLSSSMSAVLPNINNLRAGGVKFSNRVAPTMVDFSSANPAANQRALLDMFYSAVPTGSTPTVTTLTYVGNLFQNDTAQAYIQQACQRNAVMVVTDGFANDYRGLLGGVQALSPQAFSTSGGTSSTSPYDTTWSGSLAGVAANYYFPARPLGNPALTPGLVPVDSNAAAVNADLNPNLHLNTYAMTLGAKGTLFGNGGPADLDPFANPPVWPLPVSNMPSAIDDLWHASINGRGKTVVVVDSVSAIRTIKSILADLLNRASASAPVVLSSPNIQPGDNTAFLTSFNPAAWSGDLTANAVDTTTGAVSTTPLWSLQARLDATSWTSRLFATSAGGKGVAFPAGINTAVLASGAVNDGDCVANYLMGDRSNEAGLTAVACNGSVPPYRARTHVLGDLVDAAPVLVKNLPTRNVPNDASFTAFASQISSRPSVVYQGGNDGMLHAVDAASGNELWNYIPSALLPRLSLLANPAYSHAFMVDGTPWVADVKTAAGWSTLLVGGLRAGGTGYYALDVTNPVAANAAAVAAKVKWEFPNAATPAATAAGVGNAYGQPLTVNTAAGTVVLVSSGYNNADNQGHLFALDPASGAVLADLATGQGSAAAPAGLAMFTAFSPDGVTATRAYAGDLNGNLFAFDLSAANPANWTVRLLAVLSDGNGNPQPVTSTPVVTVRNGNPYVYVGTGRLLDRSDVVANPQTQSVYALTDDGSSTYGIGQAIRSAGTGLLQQVLTVGGSGLRTATQGVLTARQRGWYIDLPAGEEVTVDMLLAGTTLVFNTNAPSATACLSASYQYRLDAVSGGMQSAALFPAGLAPFAGQWLGSALATAPVLGVLGGGTWVSETHLSDGSVRTELVPAVTVASLRKQGWREIRQ